MNLKLTPHGLESRGSPFNQRVDENVSYDDEVKAIAMEMQVVDARLDDLTSRIETFLNETSKANG